MKRAWLWIGLLIVVLAGAGAVYWFVYRPQAAVTECSGVTFYTDANYSGTAACLTPDTYTTADLNVNGLENRSITSIQVDPGFKVTVYDEDELKGESLELTVDTKNLNDVKSISDQLFTNWDNRIFSVKVEIAPSCGAAVFDFANYGGFGTCLPVGEYNTAALEAKNMPDNKIASIKIYTGFKATVYVDNDYKGNSFEFTADAVNLDVTAGGGETRWDDKISSIKVAAAKVVPTPNGSVTLTADGKDAVDIDSGDSVTLTWTLVNLVASTCTGAPSGWFVANNSLTGTATATPTDDTTYKLTCGAYSDEVTVNILSEESTCTAPLNETRTQTCPTGQTGSITQTRTKGVAPTCAWGDWTDTSDTCATSTTTTTTPTTPTTTTTPTTATTQPASTGPETPLVAGGLLSLALGAYYLIKRKI